MSHASTFANPSDAAAQGILNDLRYRPYVVREETPVANRVERVMRALVPGRIVGAESWIRTGGGNVTTADVRVNGATVLAAVMSHDGATDAELIEAGLKTDHADYDATDKVIKFDAGDVISVVWTALGAGAAGGQVQVNVQF